MSTALQIVIADPTIKGIHTVAAIQRVVARSAGDKIVAVTAVAAVIAAGGLHRPQHQIGMAEAGTVSKAHSLDSVPVIDHRFGDGDSVVGPNKFEHQRSAVGALLDNQIRS